jgi:hypothetical protein
MTSRKMTRRRCEVYLACVMDSKKKIVESPHCKRILRYISRRIIRITSEKENRGHLIGLRLQS